MNQSLAIVVKLLFALTFGGLDHYRISNWPVKSWSMETEIHESFCYVLGGYTYFFI